MTKETKEFQESYLKAVSLAKKLGINEDIAEIAQKGSQNITGLENPEQDRGIMEKALYVKVFSAVKDIVSVKERDAFLQEAKNANIAKGDFNSVFNSLEKHGKKGADTLLNEELDRLANSSLDTRGMVEEEPLKMTPIKKTTHSQQELQEEILEGSPLERNTNQPNTNQKTEENVSNKQEIETDKNPPQLEISLEERVQQLRNKGKVPSSGQEVPNNSQVGKGIPSGNNPEPKSRESKTLQPPPLLSEHNKNLEKEVEEIQKKNEELKKEPPLKSLDLHKEEIDLESDEKKKKGLDNNGMSITFDTTPPSDKKNLGETLAKYTFDFEGKKHEASVQNDPKGGYSVNISPLTPGKEAEAMKAMFESMGIKPAPEPQIINGVRVYDLNAEQSKIFQEKTGVKEPEKNQDKILDKDKDKDKEENKETDKSKQQDKPLDKDKNKQQENKGPNFSSSNHTGVGGGNKSGFGSFGGNKLNINVENANGVQKPSSVTSDKQPGKGGQGLGG